MACNAVHSWTFCGLIGAFLDLGLAYLMLCGSTLAFFASKFLAVFGLYLPCPCNGLFGDPNGDMCVQRLLVDCPTSNISSVQMSLKTKFPFDSIWMKDHHGCQLNFKLVRDDGLLEMEGDASCSSFYDASASGLRSLDSPVLRQGLTDVKGKGISNQKPRSAGLRRRRRALVEHDKFSPVSSFDPLRLTGPDVSLSPYNVSRTSQEITEEDESLVPVNSGGDGDGDGLQPDEEAPTGFDLFGGTQHCFDLNESLVESQNSAGELVCNAQQELGFDGNETNAISVLEQALEEEHAACDALYLELEKERSAAATAADEAMAMILRLQKEKASIEMEARQYQRMIEEKYAYDEEEMNILKEILMRREREKHFLEKEVEAYRQMMLNGNEQLEDDLHDMTGMSGQRLTSSFDSSEDPVFMLQRINESISKREMAKDVNKFSDYDAFPDEKQGCNLAFGEESLSIGKHHLHVTECMDECNQDFQEKGMVSMDEHLSGPQGQGLISETSSSLCELNGPQGNNLLEKTIIFVDEEQGQKDNARLCQGMARKTNQTCTETEISFPCDGADLEKHWKDADQGVRDPHTYIFDTERSVHDVHVIDDKSKLCNQANGKESELLSMDTALDSSRKCGLPFEASCFRRIDALSDCPSTSRAETEPNIHRSRSDMSNGLPPINKSQDKAFLFDLHRNSMSAVDNERLKLESEVGWLRERLRIVQEGREKLSFSVEHWEREKIQLQLLEDIVSQLREIRQLTEPGKAVRQASLPPSSSKISTKKRRCRSVSLGVHESS